MGRLSMVAALLWLCLGASADAQDTLIPRPVAVPRDPNGWSEGKTRVFFAGSASIGTAARSEVSIGYGMPHWAYVAVETAGGSTGEHAFTSVRGRLSLLYVDVAAGWGKVFGYKHTRLPKLDRYDALSVPGADDAKYQALQLWVFGLIPAPGGYVQYELEGVRPRDLDDGQAVYEELLRAVIVPGWTLAGRLGYAFQFAQKRGAIGALGEAVWVEGREGYVARVGPIVSWAFSQRIDLSLTATVPVHTDDEIDLYHGIWGTARARYRFATGGK